MQRALKGVELHFSNPSYQENLLLGIKFEDPKLVSKVAENFKKIFSGFRLKVIDDHFVSKENAEIPIHKIPNWIQDCRSANFWVFDHHTLPLNEGMATIAANDNILVINSSHTLSDGGFMVSALSQCLNDMSNLPNNSNAPLYSSDAFKHEFEEAEKKFDRKNIWPMNKLTSCKYDTNDCHLAPPGTQYIDYEEIFPVDQLACYDSSKKKPQSLSEVSSIGIALSILALNKVNNNIDYRYNEPISITTVFDVRRFAKKQPTFNWSFGNCVAQPTIKADVSHNDTIEKVCKKFRDYINILNPHGAFYSAGHMSDLLITPPKVIFGCLSSIGPINFKRPIVDFDIRDCARMDLGKGDHGEKHGSQFTILSYSKINEDRQDFFCLGRFFPALTTVQNGTILYESFKHFMKKVPLNAQFDDALHELISFQKVLKRNF